jgi:hypothetical protein
MASLLGRRVDIEGHRATIRYIGAVPPAEGLENIMLSDCACFLVILLLNQALRTLVKVYRYHVSMIITFNSIIHAL